MSDAITVSACDDCIIAAANDEWPDRDVELADLIAARDNGTAPWLYGRRLEREPDPLALLTDIERLVDNCDEDHEEHFSSSPCDTCGSRLSGNRHRGTIIRF